MSGAARIHPTAIIEDGAEVGQDVSIGPYTVVEAGARVGDGCTLGVSVHIHGCVRLGAESRVGSGTVLGGEPQALKSQGGASVVRIGTRCRIHEHVTVHRSMFAGGETVIEDEVMLMATAHVAHDCRVGANAILTNGSMLAGHVEIGERAILSGNVAVHQFCRVGRFVMLGGGCMIGKDAAPFSIYTGLRPARWRGLNTIGLRRGGFAGEERTALRHALRELIHGGRNPAEVAHELAASPLASVAEIGTFVLAAKRGVQGIGIDSDEADES